MGKVSKKKLTSATTSGAESDALKKANARHKELENGDFKFTARGEANTLLPTEHPHFHLDLVTKEVGEQRLESTLTGFFSSVEEGDTPRQVVKITMGAGKTTQDDHAPEVFP